MKDEAGWYPVALAAGIEPGTSAGTRLFGRELVVWRDAVGVSHVWEDRCPHRGMRLSFGFVRGGHIACLYHGWQFDAAGRCRFIPAHPKLDVPETIMVTRFASAEQAGIVWVLNGGTGEGASPPGGNAATTPVRSITILAGEAAVRTALGARASPFSGEELATIEPEGALLWLRAGTETLVLAVQPLGEHETCLHVAIAGAVTGDRAPQRAAVSRWAEELRRAAETSDAARAA